MRILLCCGAGMSSGFLAQKVRKAAKKEGISVVCEAHPESTIGTMVQNFDVVCLGPHLKPELPTVEELCAPFGVKVFVIPSDIYSLLDGAGLFALCKKTLGQ